MDFRNPKIWYIIAAVLFIPAYLINLDLIPLNDDEAIRTIVAMEMELSGNYIVPTWNGELYTSKPPLFNWILLQSFHFFGEVNEFSARFPNILFLGIFGFVIYFFSSKHLSKEYSLLSAMLFLTCGRIMFWDSFLAYIDILYSLISFTGFMIIYHQYEKGNFLKLFLYSYFLCAAGFMLKGFPSLLFQGITLLTYFIYQRNWKKLFSIQHIAGILLFALIVGGYYFAYFQQADGLKTIEGLLDQSTRRTAIHDQYNYLQFFLHLITYPFENIYHFLPWSIMAIYFFSKSAIKKIKNEPFLVYSALTFMSNIIIYWISVEVYPRYILMLIPFALGILLYLHKLNYDKQSNLYKIYFRTHQFLFIGVMLTAIVALFQTLQTDIPYRYLKMGAGITAFGIVFYYFNKFKNIRLITFVIAVLILRILFNWFVLPERFETGQAAVCKEQAINLGKTYKNDSLTIYKNSNIDLTSSVYITRERGEITRRTDYIVQNGASIIDTARQAIPPNTVILDRICVRAGQQTLFVVQKGVE